MTSMMATSAGTDRGERSMLEMIPPFEVERRSQAGLGVPAGTGKTGPFLALTDWKLSGPGLPL